MINVVVGVSVFVLNVVNVLIVLLYFVLIVVVLVVFGWLCVVV